MTKFFFLIILWSITFTIDAQDIKDIRNYSLLGQTQKGKDAVDKFLSVPKNALKPEGWFYKGVLYSEASKDSTKSAIQNAEMKAIAFAALKKYRELDPKVPLMEERNNSPIYDLYVGYYSDLGVKAYLAKDPAAGFEYFKKALEVHDYIASNHLIGNNGFKFSALDTTLVLYSAIAATEAKMLDDAAIFYKKLTDAEVSDQQYIDAYQVLAERYKTIKDKAAFADIIAKGKKLYPNNIEYWIALQIEEATDGVGKPEVFSKYDELMGKISDNYTLLFNYGVELYRYIYSDEMQKVNTTEYKNKLPEVMKKAIAIKSTSEANFLLANFYYYNAIDISEEARTLKAVKPDELKKKKDLQAQSDLAMTQAIPFAEANVALFAKIAKPKSSEKINCKQSLVILKNIYEAKKDAEKIAIYDAKIKAFD
jgi:hypothetical protein